MSVLDICLVSGSNPGPFADWALLIAFPTFALGGLPGCGAAGGGVVGVVDPPVGVVPTGADT